MKRSDLEAGEISGLRYLCSLPGEATGRRPVLCFLHGLDEGPPTDILSGVTRHGPLRQGSSPLATREFIVLAPQLPERGDLWRFYADAVVRIVREFQAQQGGDPRRTFLTGFSFGANGVFDLALRVPAMWGALWPVDPTRVPAKDPGLPIWLSSGEVSRYGGGQFIERLRLHPPGTAGAEDRVYADEGLDHVGTATSAYKDDRIYRWLLKRG